MLAAYAAIERLETGRRRGFGSLKVEAQIGDTSWRTSVFPQREQSEWVLLVSRKVLRAERLEQGKHLKVTLTL